MKAGTRSSGSMILFRELAKRYMNGIAAYYQYQSTHFPVQQRNVQLQLVIHIVYTIVQLSSIYNTRSTQASSRCAIVCFACCKLSTRSGPFRKNGALESKGSRALLKLKWCTERYEIFVSDQCSFSYNSMWDILKKKLGKCSRWIKAFVFVFFSFFIDSLPFLFKLKICIFIT